MFFSSRRRTTPPSLASYTPEPDFGLSDADVGREAQGHKEDWESSIAFLNSNSSPAPPVTETAKVNGTRGSRDRDSQEPFVIGESPKAHGIVPMASPGSAICHYVAPRSVLTHVYPVCVGLGGFNRWF
ncbi:hypothetical protein llap_671 [Limosa lapponica baueri]|uniref:Uncharacterized protein n=1 Tax=Limosa lapponica baueri TaxID=1758121 RepID=A0A2I0USL7_LIMLA|nr:hypothetical protein llap_671 [Limosa lapponica baueri]